MRPELSTESSVSSPRAGTNGSVKAGWLCPEISQWQIYKNYILKSPPIIIKFVKFSWICYLNFPLEHSWDLFQWWLKANLDLKWDSNLDWRNKIFVFELMYFLPRLKSKSILKFMPIIQVVSFRGSN